MYKTSTVMLLTVAVMAGISTTAYGAEDKECDLDAVRTDGSKINLERGCVYRGHIIIDKSNTTLACNGATLIGDKGEKYGILVKGRGLNNITVSDCRLQGYDTAAVMIMSGLKSDELSRDYQQSFKLAPHDVTLERLTVEGARGNGVHFNGYVNKSSLKDSTVTGSRKVGVYLGGSTRDITLANNTFSQNGGVNEKKQREAVAIDSSARNIIVDNKFIGNAAGGIFLYKNCGEHNYRPGATLRWQSSNDNLISRNIFTDEKIGVWVASRQSKDLSGWGCGDPSVGVGNKFYRDYANHNIISDNAFCRSKTAVRIEGDDNRLADNYFDSKTAKSIDMPYQNRPKPDGAMTIGNIVDALPQQASNTPKCDP